MKKEILFIYKVFFSGFMLFFVCISFAEASSVEIKALKWDGEPTKESMRGYYHYYDNNEYDIQFTVGGNGINEDSIITGDFTELGGGVAVTSTWDGVNWKFSWNWNEKGEDYNLEEEKEPAVISIFKDGTDKLGEFFVINLNPYEGNPPQGPEGELEKLSHGENTTDWREFDASFDFTDAYGIAIELEHEDDGMLGMVTFGVDKEGGRLNLVKKETIDQMAELGKYLRIEKGKIYFDADTLDEFNIPTKLKMYNLDYSADPSIRYISNGEERVVVRDGSIVDDSIITSFDFTEGTAIFEITGWSAYEAFESTPVISRPSVSRRSSSAQSQVSNLFEMGNYEYAIKIMKEYPHLFSDDDIEEVYKKLEPEEDEPAEDKESPVLPPFIFYRNLTIGFTGEDVKELQKFLNSQGFLVAETGYGSPGQETEYFGPLTRDALSKFQQANNIHPPQGYFGPITRNFIAGMEKETIVQTPTEISPGTFNRNLTAGSTGNDVRDLQRFLNQNGFIVSVSGPGSSENETTYFGELTRDALSKFQQANNIHPPQGYFGPITRSFIQSGNF